MTFADKGYQGAGGSIRTPFKRHRRRRRLSRREKAVNRSHAKIRAIGERAIATLKCWKLLAKLHCCPKRATNLLAAILVLQLVESEGVVTREGYKIPTRYTHRQLATMIGSKRETVTKAFTLLQQAGAVELKRRHIHVRDIEALKKIAARHDSVSSQIL